MFTGIVQGMAHVQEITDLADIRRLTICFPPEGTRDLSVGASVSIGGVCLTVTATTGDVAEFDVIPESLARTTLGRLETGDAINYERAATFGSEIGGHVLSGHVSGVVEVVGREDSPNACVMTLLTPPEWLPYLLPKGFVALNGCSLTIGAVDESTHQFQVHLIPETLRITTFGSSGIGTSLNLEVDAMTQAVVATVERVLARQADRS